MQINFRKQGGLEIRLLEDQDSKTESRKFSPKIMQICCKPDGLENKGPNN